jgi:hypothetical protein
MWQAADTRPESAAFFAFACSAQVGSFSACISLQSAVSRCGRNWHRENRRGSTKMRISTEGTNTNALLASDYARLHCQMYLKGRPAVAAGGRHRTGRRLEPSQRHEMHREC